MLTSRNKLSSVVLLAATVLSKKSVTAFRPAAAFSGAARRTFHASSPTTALGASFASPDQVKDALAEPATTVLDVRRVDEILDSGLLKTNCQWVHAACTPTETPLLDAVAESLIPDKQACVVVYCASGMRAERAKETLEGLGYEKVLNAGGLGDLDYLK